MMASSLDASPGGDGRRVAASPHGMVSTAHPLATDAGVEMLHRGGNAVDAAVAAAFALGVCEPHASGLGGQTMMLLHLPEPRKNVALDGSSRAPNRATVDLFGKKRPRRLGPRAATVPSTPAVLGYAARTYGRLPLADLLEPAVRAAREGYAVTELQHRIQAREETDWSAGNAGEVFLGEGGRPRRPGDILRQPALAGTLERLGRRGVEDFYQGETAEAIARDMAERDGLIQRDDLARIPWPIERKPLSCRFEGYRLLTFPPPGAGRTLVEMLNILSHFPEKKRDLDRPEGALLLAEIIRRAQLDRRDRPFDPNFYPQVAAERMKSADYARLVARQVRSRLSARRPSPPLGPTDGRGVSVEGGGETTHLSVMDGEGGVAALTQSIERIYGSLVVHPDLGFLYNNYMSAFEYEDLTHPYFLHPNGVPWASVAPTLVFRGRKPYLALGSPGSERIASAVLQVFLRLRTVSPFLAVSAPRLHCSAAGRVSLESPWMRDDIPDLLHERGFQVEELGALTFYLGAVQLVMLDRGVRLGVADPRRDGTARGADRPPA